MPAIVRSEFALALNQVCSERGISPEVVLESIKAAISAAYRKDYGVEEIEDIEISVDLDDGKIKIMKGKKDITPAGFGRIAAQTAKQVILQKIREAEKKAIISDYSTRLNTMVNGLILRFDGPNIIVDIGKAEGLMPPEEQVNMERYRLNQHLTFYIVEIRETLKGSQIIVSRAHKDLVKLLFKREVPEIQSKAVEIKEIAREPGARTKVAVFSKQPGVDPVGSCVGQKGVRVHTVINELGGFEKVDIIQWNKEIDKYILAALSPAENLSVAVDQKKKIAKVSAPEDQLSLAIGREGQNVRLAAKLTGYKIDIIEDKAKKTVKKEKEEKVEKKDEKKKIAKVKEKKTKVKGKKAVKKEKKTKDE